MMKWNFDPKSDPWQIFSDLGVWFLVVITVWQRTHDLELCLYAFMLYGRFYNLSTMLRDIKKKLEEIDENL